MSVAEMGTLLKGERPKPEPADDGISVVEYEPETAPTRDEWLRQNVGHD